MGDSSEGNTVWHRLPVEILEHVLSLLSVTVLCRLRSVCKSWNELINNSAFHDLCDRNNNSAPLLFMWRKDPEMDCIRPFSTSRFVTATLTFLDVDANRWYSIPATDLPRIFGKYVDTRMIAMDNGLVCKLNSVYDPDIHDLKFSLLLSDLVSNRQRILPTPPTVYDREDFFPHVVPVVDNVTHRYKVFLFNNLDAAVKRVYVLKPFTNEWQAVEGLWERRVHDAIGFRNTVYAAEEIRIQARQHAPELRLFSYQNERDSFVEVWRMSFRRIVPNARLVVTDNRLFVIVVVLRRPCRNLQRVDGDCPNAKSVLQRHREDRVQVLEMYEIMRENGRQPVVQLTSSQLHQIFGGRHIDDKPAENTYGYPCFDSNGRCSSVVLVHRRSGRVRTYHLDTGSVDVLPHHPFPRPAQCGVRCSYESKTMKLSLRNVLAQWPWSC